MIWCKFYVSICIFNYTISGQTFVINCILTLSQEAGLFMKFCTVRGVLGMVIIDWENSVPESEKNPEIPEFRIKKSEIRISGYSPF